MRCTCFMRVGLTDHSRVSNSGETRMKSPMLLERWLRNKGVLVLGAKMGFFSECCMALATANERVDFTKTGAKALRSLETRSANGSFAKRKLSCSPYKLWVFIA